MILRQIQHGIVALAALCGFATAASALELHSPAFIQGGVIPAHMTCMQRAGEIGRSPPLEWFNVPFGTKSFVLTMMDRDARDPAAPTRYLLHWSMYNLPAGTTWLTEGINGAPGDARDGANDRHETGYLPPCPPAGSYHRYIITLYALDMELPNLGAAAKESLESAMKGHVLASADLVGIYAKPARIWTWHDEHWYWY
jgi:Raf kinase inhibitor-like YbhB/YbcL family protein